MLPVSLHARLSHLVANLGGCSPTRAFGQLTGVSGLSVELAGLSSWLSIGDHLTLRSRDGSNVAGEVIGFRAGFASVMAYAPLSGLGPGSETAMEPRWNDLTFASKPGRLAVCDSWLGRVIDPNALALDGKGPLLDGASSLAVHSAPPDATLRARLGPRVDLGVKVLDVFTPARHGQRIGLFAGSGVGKSTLLAMLARNTECDVAVVALVGERGREVREFIEDELEAEGLKRAVVIVATSDSPPLMRREAAYTAMTIAEYFRDQGKNVLLLMDSVTRFCSALREIALSMGEPPANRGYPPSVFAELPRLLERAGPGIDRGNARSGQITAIFTVLVEGDDHNEPVADAIRGILDGHIKLDRRIAESGRYPAVDVLGSLSRTAASCLDSEEAEIAKRVRAVMSVWKEMGEMVRLGVYRAGSDAAVEEAVQLIPTLERALNQAKSDRTSVIDSFNQLRRILEHRNGS